MYGLGVSGTSPATNLGGALSGTLPVSNGGTGVTTSTGTTNVVLSGSPTIATPTLTGAIPSYNGLTTAGQGLPVILASVARTGINASDGAGINFVASAPAAGLYRVVSYLLVTTLFTTSGPLITLTYTDPQQAQTITGTTAATAAGSLVQATQIFQSSGAAQITYKVTSAGTFGACSAYLVLERLV